MTDSTALTPSEEKALIAMEEELAQRALALKENVRAAGNNVTVQKSGKFLFPNGTEADEFEAIILDARYRNQYFPKVFKKGVFNESVCFAVGLNPDGLIPADSSPQKQHPTCAGCPMNEFGSHPSGRGGKACQNQFLLAIMWPDIEGQSDDIFIVKASPTAAKQVGAHVLNMADRAGHPMKVVTKFTIDTTDDFQSLRASYAGPNTLFGTHFSHLKSAERALKQLPVMSTSDTEATNKKADTSAARGGGRSRAS